MTNELDNIHDPLAFWKTRSWLMLILAGSSNYIKSGLNTHSWAVSTPCMSGGSIALNGSGVYSKGIPLPKIMPKIPKDRNAAFESKTV